MFPASMPRSCGDFGECMGTRFGLVSSMNGCLRFVIGVLAYTTMIRIVRYGFKAKVPCLLTKEARTIQSEFTCVPVHIL